MDISSKIESVLFWRAEPISVKQLAQILSESESVVEEGLSLLEKSLQGRGLSLVRKDNEVTLATSANNGAFIEKLQKEELSRDIGKSGLETLTIILYCAPISRRDIDYIRGVNSTFIIRNLLVRALIEKVEDSNDQRVFLYKPSFELLAYLGVSKLELLPEYEKMRAEYRSFVDGRNKEASSETSSPNDTEARGSGIEINESRTNEEDPQNDE